MQLDLFCNIKCDHCGKGKSKKSNALLFDGFRDADTGQIVCSNCRKLHYFRKAKASGSLQIRGIKYSLGEMTYSEMPVYAVGNRI
jgi:hypothetical protein